MNNFSELDRSIPYYLVVGDCATNHIYKWLELDSKVYSIQIQGGLGYERYFEDLNNCKGILLFVSWANAISVTENEEEVTSRIKSHKLILSLISESSVPALVIDRQGFLDRYCEKSKFPTDNGVYETTYIDALRKGWRPQSLIEQIQRRVNYYERIRDSIADNVRYFDLMNFVGMTTYRHESGECKNNLVNLAPWHYDLPSYQYASIVFTKFVSGEFVIQDLSDWEINVIDIK